VIKLNGGNKRVIRAGMNIIRDEHQIINGDLLQSRETAATTDQGRLITGPIDDQSSPRETSARYLEQIRTLDGNG
jgi:hypothetical protein